MERIFGKEKPLRIEILRGKFVVSGKEAIVGIPDIAVVERVDVDVPSTVIPVHVDD